MLNLTALDKVLKEVYVPAVREQMQKATILLSKVQKTAEHIDATGKYAVIPLMLGFSEGIGARGENEDLPEPSSSRYERITIDVKTNYGTIYVTGHAIRQTRNDAGAFVRAVDSEIRNMVDGLKRDINRQMFGDGSGTLATLRHPVPTSNILLVNTAQYFKKGMKIDIHTSPTITTATVTNVKYDANEIEVDNVVVAPVDTVITRHGAKDKEIYGLGNIVNNTTWLLNPADVPEWKANIVSLPSNYTSADILNALQKAYTLCEKYASAPNLAITTYEIRDLYASTLTTMRRIVNTMDLEFGYKGLEFNGLPLVADDQCPDKVLYFLNTKHLILATASDFDWADEDGKILDKVPGKDAYRAYMYFASNFATDRRNAHAKVIGW